MDVLSNVYVYVKQQIVAFGLRTKATSTKIISYQGPAVKLECWASCLVFEVHVVLLLSDLVTLRLAFVSIRFPCNYLFRLSSNINHLHFV